MIEDELHELIEKVRRRGCEWQTTEVKAAHRGCPERLYDTISAFSNQNDGGVMLFGLDERNQFEKVGVYDAQTLQKKVMEYCEQMTPVVRPVFTVWDEEGKVFVSAEIPPLDVAERPCFRTAQGRLKGSYKRVGDADKPMTEYEVYSYEAFRKRYRDDIRPAKGVTPDMLNQDLLGIYQARMRNERPNLARVTEQQQYELNGVTQGGKITLAAVLLFGLFPQAFYPRLYISATRIPGMEMGVTDLFGNRFSDSKRIEGTIPEMLQKALDFVRNNMHVSTGIDPLTGKRIDIPQYPMDAVREAVLNALVHRDYSIHTESKPIQLNMYEDRMEIINPGGLYGRLTIDQLGYMQPDTRNPIIVTAMEIMDETENRYSGIPTIRNAMAQRKLPEPLFVDTTGEFKVILYHSHKTIETVSTIGKAPASIHAMDEKQLLEFCHIPRTRSEIISYLNIGSGQYALRRYLDPLLKQGLIRMTIPEKPRSHSQKYVTVEDPFGSRKG